MSVTRLKTDQGTGGHPVLLLVTTLITPITMKNTIEVMWSWTSLRVRLARRAKRAVAHALIAMK